MTGSWDHNSQKDRVHNVRNYYIIISVYAYIRTTYIHTQYTYLQEVDGGYGDGAAEAKVLEGGKDGDGADSEGGDIGGGGDGDGDACSLHGERYVFDEGVALPLLLGNVLEAPQDDKHVVDADAQGQEGEHAVDGCVPEAEAGRQPKRYDDGETDVLSCFLIVS